MSEAVVGRLLSAPTLERGVEATLRAWLGWYLAEVLEQDGRGRYDLPDPTDVVKVADFGWEKDAQLGLVVVATPGTTGDARREVKGYAATWEIMAAVLCDLGKREESREAAQYYAAAVGSALDHKGIALTAADGTWEPEEDGSVPIVAGTSTRWIGETYRQLSERDGRALIAGQARVLVMVENARSIDGGPAAPPVDGDGTPTRDPVDPPEPAPVVPTLTIEALEPEPLPEDL